MNILRWILILPVAIVTGWLTHVAIVFGNRITMGFSGVDPNGFFAWLFIEVMSSAMMLCVFIIVGHRIAPTRKTETACCMTVLALLFAGMASHDALLRHEYWSLLGVAGGVVGSGAALWSIVSGESLFG